MTWLIRDKPRRSRKRLFVPLALLGAGAAAVQYRKRRHHPEQAS